MNDRLTLAELGEIERRAEQATEGPWFVDGAAPGEMGLVMVRPEHGDYITANFGINRAYPNGGWDNAEFIAHSRHDIPILTAELRRAWEALALATGRHPGEDTSDECHCGTATCGVCAQCRAADALPEDWPR